MNCIMRNQHFAYAKTKAQVSFTVTAKLISAFFATRLVQFLYFLNPKLPSSVLVKLGICPTFLETTLFWFSHDAAQMVNKNSVIRVYISGLVLSICSLFIAIMAIKSKQARKTHYCIRGFLFIFFFLYAVNVML